jgi:hypothetical protein
MTAQIVVAAALVQTGELLLVHKRGTDFFMLPGSKLEPDETPVQAVARKLREPRPRDQARLRRRLCRRQADALPSFGRSFRAL